MKYNCFLNQNLHGLSWSQNVFEVNLVDKWGRWMFIHSLTIELVGCFSVDLNCMNQLDFVLEAGINGSVACQREHAFKFFRHNQDLHAAHISIRVHYLTLDGVEFFSKFFTHCNECFWATCASITGKSSHWLRQKQLLRKILSQKERACIDKELVSH